MQAKRPAVYCQRYLPLLEASVMMLYSGGGVGKSFAAIRESLEFVWENPAKQAALWLTEDSEGETRRRYERLVALYDQPKDFFDSRISFIAQEPMRLTKMQDGNAILSDDFLDVRLALLDYSLVVLDPLLQFNGCDENSNTHAGVLMGALKEWAASEDKIILLLHHATWAGQSGKIKPRGAGEWVNGTRGVYEISRLEDEHKKDRRLFTLTKDNGLSYYFRDTYTDEPAKELDVFPEFIKEEVREANLGNVVKISVADHNDAKNPHGFKPFEIDFGSLHLAVMDGLCYSPYLFANGHRKNENNLGGAEVMCFDFDNGLTLEQGRKRFAHYQSLLVTTRSHQKEGKGDRFRVFIRLKTPLNIPNDDYSDFMDALFEAVRDVDPATKDLARFYFASPKDATHIYSKSMKRYDWEPLYRQVKREKVVAEIQAAKKKRKPVNGTPRSTTEPENTLPKDTTFLLHAGASDTFGNIRHTLGHGDKVAVQCRHGYDHSGQSPSANLAAFIKKHDNGNVYYHCSGGRCAGEEALFCAEWEG
jgi:hypothetical protein